MACCYSRSMLLAMYPDTEGCKCCHFKRRRDRVLRKVPTEVVTTNTVPLPTEDVDELVSLIEGTHVVKGKPPPKRGDPKKLAKKARQRERKRLEEEAIRRAEEERLRKEEEARIRLEEEARQAELKKKREKKKQRKLRKKLANTELKATRCTTVKESDKTLDGDIKAESPSTSKPCLSTPPPNLCSSRPTLQELSDIVTIRRHSTLPDTTVTISMRRQSGDEDVLYTLVNGQVCLNSNSSSSGSTKSSPTSKNNRREKGKRKGKKKNGNHTLENEVSASNATNGTQWTGEEWLTNSRNTGYVKNELPNSGFEVRTFLPPSTATSLSAPPQINSLARAISNFGDFEGDEIDLSKLKLPPGITITKVTQRPITPEECTELNNADDHVPLPPPPPGTGVFNTENNIIVMNSANCDEYEQCNGEDIYPTFGQTHHEEFETVISNKEKRKRSKANRTEEVTDRRDSNEICYANGTNDKGKTVLKCRDGKTNIIEGRRNSSHNATSKKDKSCNSRNSRKGNSEQIRSGNRSSGSMSSNKSNGTMGRIEHGINSIEGSTYRVSSSTPPVMSPMPGPLFQPTITPHTPVKMADVVTGNHIKMQQEEYERARKNSEDSIRGTYQVDHYDTNNVYHRPDQSRSISPEINNHGYGGCYNLWSSTKPQEGNLYQEPTKTIYYDDISKKVEENVSKPQAEISWNSYQEAIDFGRSRVMPPPPPIRRPSPILSPLVRCPLPTSPSAHTNGSTQHPSWGMGYVSNGVDQPHVPSFTHQPPSNASRIPSTTKHFGQHQQETNGFHAYSTRIVTEHKRHVHSQEAPKSTTPPLTDLYNRGYQYTLNSYQEALFQPFSHPAQLNHSPVHHLSNMRQYPVPIYHDIRTSTHILEHTGLLCTPSPPPQSQTPLINLLRSNPPQFQSPNITSTWAPYYNNGYVPSPNNTTPRVAGAPESVRRPGPEYTLF